MSVPESASCYNNAQNKALETYKNYQKKNCNSFIKQAQASIAEKNYSLALENLTQIDSTSPCNTQSNALIKSVENKISAEEKRFRHTYEITQRCSFIRKNKNKCNKRYRCCLL
jgi:hypothetical protein